MSDHGCPEHPLYRPVVSNAKPWHAPHCPQCSALWLEDGTPRGSTAPKVLKGLRAAYDAAPQDSKTPWWLRHRK